MGRGRFEGIFACMDANTRERPAVQRENALLRRAGVPRYNGRQGVRRGVVRYFALRTWPIGTSGRLASSRRQQQFGRAVSSSEKFQNEIRQANEKEKPDGRVPEIQTDGVGL